MRLGVIYFLNSKLEIDGQQLIFMQVLQSYLIGLIWSISHQLCSSYKTDRKFMAQSLQLLLISSESSENIYLFRQVPSDIHKHYKVSFLKIFF